MQGRIHMACKEKCGKTLICGHRYWLLVNILIMLSQTPDKVIFDAGICEGVQQLLGVRNISCCKMIHRALDWSDVSCIKWT